MLALMAVRRYTHHPLGQELPDLLRERGWSQRQLAAAVGVDPAHISRTLGRSAPRGPSAGLAGRVALALDLPPDYFPEYREEQVIAAVRRDPQLRERLYRTLGRTSSGPAAALRGGGQDAQGTYQSAD
jgi:transcriptional regulator with XRE-family HTH domain